MANSLVFVPLANTMVPWANISTPFLFLKPEEVRNINLSIYIHLAATGVIIWDFLDNLRNDFTMPMTPRTRLPTMLYFVVRLSMVACCIGRAVLLTMPIAHCGRLSQVLDALLTINVICLTGLCYLRIIVIYSENRYVVGFFGLTWLSVVAMALTFFKTFGAVRILPTRNCKEIIQGPFAVPTLAALAFNDTLIYFAIAYRIYNIFLTYDFDMNLKRKLAVIAFGASLPTAGSKIVLLESQLYCLLIVISKACVLIIVSIDEEENFMFLIVHLVLTTILISRVYRELLQVRVYPRQRNREEFGGILTSAEFAPNFSADVRPRILERPNELQDSMIAVVSR